MNIKEKGFIKWAGSKRRQRKLLSKLAPASWQGTYREPFAGAGWLWRELAEQGRISQAVLSDACRQLILCWRGIGMLPNEVADELASIQHDFSDMGEGERLDYYDYLTMEMGNFPTFSQAGMRSDRLSKFAAEFIALNRLCHSGLWRVNRDGEFNVPAAADSMDRNLTSLPSRKLIEHYADLLGRSGTNITNHAYPYAISDPDNGFVYLDPPFFGTYNGYVSGGFDHDKFIDHVTRYSSESKVLLSNSYAPQIVEPLEQAGFRIGIVSTRQTISATSEGRGQRIDIVALNYDDPVDQYVANDKFALYEEFRAYNG